jgi:uncharacterized protein involved in exopolysaccharide biosynthesis
MNFDEMLSAETAMLALKRWPSFLLIVGLALTLGVITYIFLPREYNITAEVIGTRYESDITPNNQSNSFSAAALLGGSQNDLPNINDFKLFTQLLTSPELGATLVDDPLIHRIYKELWVKDHWQRPDTAKQHVTNYFNKWLGLKEWAPPDGFAIARYLSTHVSIVANKDAKLITISTWTQDPELGKALITLICSRADQMVKQMAKERFAAKVTFLQTAIAESNVEETRKALAQALAKAETDDIYSQSNLPFAAEFLAPPAGPTMPQFPRFSTTLLISGGLGVLIFLFNLSRFSRTKIAVLDSRSDSIATVPRSSTSRDSGTPSSAVS